uniref:PA14 domain-containing protein n=1 Tax=viral metagenome TaxID=1070528 RepID=A0A6C0ASL5_9ZZZZ
MSNIQIVPLPNNLKLSSSTTNISGVSNLDVKKNVIPNYTPNGNYIVTSSSIVSLKQTNSMPYNIFNNSNPGIWQSDISGGGAKNGGDSSKAILYSYPAYTQNAYFSSDKTTGDTTNLTATYQGGGDPNNTWSTSVGSSQSDLPGEWVQIQLPYKIYLSKYQLVTPTSVKNGDKTVTSTFPIKFTVVGSNDGETWDYVDQQNVSTTSQSVSNTYTVTSKSPYSYFRLVVSEMNYAMSSVSIVNWFLTGNMQLTTTKSGFMTLSRAMEISDINYGNMNYMSNPNINSLLPYNNFKEGFDSHGYVVPPAQPDDLPVFNYQPGLTFTIYKGYHNDNTNYANTAKVSSLQPNSNVTGEISSIGTGTNNAIIVSQVNNNYTIQWTGFFYTGNTKKGYWKFYTESDDGSFLWVNDTLVVNNGGKHSLKKKNGTIELDSTTFYPIKILFGNSGGGHNMIVSFSPSGQNVPITDGTNYYFSLPSTNPLPALKPIVQGIQNNQIIPLQQISDDYNNTYNSMLQNSTRLNNDISKITNSQGSGIRDQLMKNGQYDFSGSSFNYDNNIVTIGDVRVQDTKSLAEQETALYMLGTLASVTLLIAAIYIAMD